MRFLFFLFIALPFSLFGKPQGRALTDSLSLVLPTLKEDTNKVNVLDNLSYTYYTIAPDSGIMYANQMLELAKKLKWEKGIAAAYNNLGVNSEAKMEHAAAVDNYNKAIELFEKLGNKEGLAGALTNIGEVYAHQSDFRSSLDYCFKALKIYEELSADRGRAMVSQNIGMTYLELKDYPSAIKYSTAAMKLYEKINNKEGIANAQINIANVHNASGAYDSALENYFAALKIMTALGHKRAMKIAIGNIGDTYTKMGNYPKALEYMQQALDISKEMNSRGGIAINLGNMGEVWYKIATDGRKNNPDKAALNKSIAYSTEAVALCKSINFIPPMMVFNEILSDAYAASGQYKQAYETFRGHVKLKDSIFSFENKMEIARLESKREVELKSKDAIIMDNQGKIRKLNKDVQRNERIIYIISIAFLLLLVGVGIKSIYRYRKSNRKLRNETTSQKRVLNEIALLHAHSVRRPIASMLGLVSLFNTKDATDPVNKEVIEGMLVMASELDGVIKEIVEKENELGIKA
jgi:tetratricopeptide (TPR) repeat protein